MAADPEPGDRAGEPVGFGGGGGVSVTGFDRTGGRDGDEPDDGCPDRDIPCRGAATHLDHLVEVARSTLVGEGVTAGGLDLVLVDVAEMAELNATHMGHDGPTDVLSFPLDADDLLAAAPHGLVGDPTEGGILDGPPLHLGDVIVCPDVARRQAPEHCGTEEAELALLVIHGVLHILGHDHVEAAETAAMQARERHHLAILGHPHPVAKAASC